MPSVDISVPGDGVWLTIAELARRKNISRQAAAKRVNALEEAGQLQTRRNGRLRQVDLAMYDRAVGQVGNGFKELAAETAREGRQSGDISLTSGLKDAQTERAKYEARLKALDFGERTGQLVPLRGEHGIESALIKVSDQILRDLGSPLKWTGDLVEAAKGGQPAMRRELQKKVRELREKIAKRLMQLAGEAADVEATGIQIDIHFEGDE